MNCVHSLNSSGVCVLCYWCSL